MYSEAVRRGSYMLSVDASTQDEADRAAEIMQKFNAVDLDQRAAHWRSTGWTGYQSDAPLYTAEQIQNERAGYTSTTTAASAASGSGTVPPASTSTAGRTGEAIPVVEEQLHVGKRAVQRGDARIYRHVTETPVQESVQLREEHVSVQRSPVDQPASAADIDTFKEGTIEVRETAEEPVVAKTARVVEEVSVGKEVTERTETISDTVRRTDAEVEQLGAKSSGSTGKAPTAAAAVNTTTLHKPIALGLRSLATSSIRATAGMNLSRSSRATGNPPTPAVPGSAPSRLSGTGGKR